MMTRKQIAAHAKQVLARSKERQQVYEMALAEGIRRGRSQITEEMKADQKVKLIEARIKLISVFGQSIQSMANILDGDRINI